VIKVSFRQYAERALMPFFSLDADLFGADFEVFSLT